MSSIYRRIALLILASTWAFGCALVGPGDPRSAYAGPFITEFGIVGPDDAGKQAVEASRAIVLTEAGRKIGFRVLPSYNVPFEAYTVLYMPDPPLHSTLVGSKLESDSGYVARTSMKMARGETFLSSVLAADDPIGIYTAELYLDGRVVSKVRFEVSSPATESDLP